MSLRKTNLLLEMAPLPLTFRGTPSEFAAEMVTRMRIVSPSGTNFIFIGDVEPTSNVGPWLKGGDRWYIYDEDLKRYVPLDITDSEKKWFNVGNSTPAATAPPFWLKTTLDATEAVPSYGSPIGWFMFNGTSWIPFTGLVPAGSTVSRPASPQALEQFYDSTISVLIWYERGAWRTVSGVPGDIKAVAFDTLTDALAHNPGWEVVGASNTNVRGRWISQATKDPGVSPETNLTVSAGIASRAAFEVFGETDGVKMDSSSDVPYPPTIALWHLVKT